MKIVYRLFIMVAFLASSLAVTSGGSAAAERLDGSRELDTAAVDAFVEERMEDGNVPGAAVVITRGENVVYVRGYGHDSAGEPITKETPFRVASVSKSFTSLAVMQLVEEGKVGLDEPVKTYLPGFDTSDPRFEEVTAHQLLNQTSGMADGGFPEISRPQPDSLAEAVERLRDAKLVADPGTQWNYHNPNYQVAARVVEVVSGKPFDEYLERHVFHPLGMDHSTTTTKDDEDMPGLADGYTFAYGRAVAVPGPGYFVNGSGGVVSTASDMARWLIMQNNGGVAANGARVVSAGSIEEMHAPSEPGGYALGWDTDGPKQGPTRIAHGGTQYTFVANEALLPDSGYGVAVLLNSASPMGIEQTNLIQGVVSIVQGDAPQPGAPVSSSTLDLLLSALTFAVLAVGTLGVLRSGRWAARRTKSPAWRVALRFLPHFVPIALCLAFPAIAGFLFGGRDVSWLSALYGWFALVALVVGVAETGVMAARIGHLVRVRARHPEAN